MSLRDAQIQFAAEFLTLMVAAGGLALTVLRPPDPRRRRAAGPGGTPAASALAALGFIIAAAAAFLHGSLIVTSDHDGLLGMARVVSAAALLPSVPAWPRRRGGRAALVVGLAGWVAAGVTELLDASTVVVAVLLSVGSLGVGAALIAFSQRSIAVRVVAASATTLLLVVLVLAVALSAVISSSLQHDELNRLSSRASTENVEIVDTAGSAVESARFVAGDLQGFFRQSVPDPLLVLGGRAAGPSPAAVRAVGERLQAVRALYPVGGYVYVAPKAPGPAVTPGLDPVLAGALERDPTLSRPPCAGGGLGSVVVIDRRAWAASSYPECLAGSSQLLGAVISVVPFDDAYLAGRRQVDPSVSLALVSGGGVVATAGGVPSAALLASAARGPGSRLIGDRLASVATVRVQRGSPPLAVLLSTPATTVTSTRTQLYRTLFLIALGGTVLAFGLAVFTGDRITAGIRRLTQVASRIQGGNTSVRAAIPGTDEVAVLGAAFDSMIDSVEDQASALQSAADDETRLRNRMEAVVAGMSDGLVAIDAGGRVTDFNRAAEDLTGVTAELALGRRVDSVVKLSGGDGQSLARSMLDAGDTPWARLATIRQADGAELPVAVSSGAVRGPAGELVGSVLVVRDLRQEQELERMKNEFLSRVGHELRTPLTGIMGYADILVRRDVPTERARVWHAEILHAARRLLRIVEMLEFFASSGAGRMPLRPESVDTRGLVSGIAAGWSSRLPDNLTIGRRVARDTPDVQADRRWLSLAVDELIDNAVKFSPDGGRIVVSAAGVPGSEGNGHGPNGAVEISVTDRGMGMTSSEHAQVFREFVQADGSDTRRFGGLGLGLALVRRVVEGHGGEVQCRSAPGRGTTVTIRLPAAASVLG
jgi:PAS domain S-box-containing protein